MSGRKSKKNQRLGSSRRGPKGLNRNTEKDDDDDGFQQIAESGEGRDEFHTTSNYHATQFDHPPSTSIEQQTSVLDCPPNARDQKDSLMETELPERKRKMGSTRKSTGRFKAERKSDDVRTTEDLDEEYVTQPNKSITEEQHASLTEEGQSSFPSDISLQTKSSVFGKESETTLMFAVSENKEKGTIQHQEITSHSHEVVSDMPIDEAMGPSVHSIAVTVAERDLLQEDSVMFNDPKTLSHQETQIASTSGQKKRMGSTRRPLGGKKYENVGEEHSRNMTENERKAEVMGKAKLKMSAEMAQTWDDVARDDPSSHTESTLLFSQSLLADRAELKEADVLTGTETIKQPVAFPLVESEKPLPETSSQHGIPVVNEALDFKFGSHTEDIDVLNKGNHLSDNSQHVSDTRKDTNPSYDFRDVNTESKKEVLKQKEEPQFEELALHDQESSLSQHDIATPDNNYDCFMVQHIVGGSRSFEMPVSNISHAEPTTTNLPHEMRDAVEERQEIHIEIKQDINVCNVVSVTCDTLTDLVSITEEDEHSHILATRENENMSNERGSETEYAFEIRGQGDVRDHNVTQIVMDVRDNDKYGETSTETIWMSHQKPCDTGQEHYSSNISLTHGLTQDEAGKMLENEEVTKDKKETENTAVNDLTSKSEEMFSFEDSATDRGSHAHQQLFMQFPDKEGYDLHENFNVKSEKGEIHFSVESENAAFDRGNERSDGTDRVMDAAPVLTLDVGDAHLHFEIEAQNRTFDSTNCKADGTEENVNAASVLVRENKVIGSTVEHNMTKSNFQSFPDAHKEALKVSENVEKEVSGETSTIPEQSDITADSHREETHSKSSPVIQKRKMGSTRRPLKGNKGRRNDDDEKEIFNMEDEPSPDESRYTAVSICDISESQTITKIHAGSQENIRDVDVAPAEGDTELHSENKVFDSTALEGEVEVRKDEVIEDTVGSNFNQMTDANKETLKVSENSDSYDLSDAIRNSQLEIQDKMTELTSGAGRTEDTICEASVSVREDEFTVDTVDMTIESDLIQSDTLYDAKLEALKVSKNTESVSAVTDSVLVQDDVTEGSRLTDTLPEQSHIDIIPEYSHGEEEQSKSSPIVHKRKMGSTRRPLRGNKGQRNEFEHHDKNETLDSEGMINAEKETISLKNEPSPDESMLQNTKDVVKEQEMEICQKNDVGPVEEFESALLQSLCTPDLVSEESTAISICHITESQTLTNIHVESQENTGDAERAAAEEDKDLQLEIDSQNKTFDLATREAEETEENIQDVSVMLIREVEVTGDTDTVESNMTTKSEFVETSPDAHMEALKVSENAEKEVSGETSTIPEQSDISVSPADSHREETHSKSSPVIQKRKMGSTRKPLKGNKGQRKDIEHHDENETLNSDCMINAEKQTTSLEDKPTSDESMLQSTNDVVKEQEMEICQKNDVGPVEEFESALLQSSCTPDLVSEESTAISICHITESQTLTNIHVESQENTGDAERAAAEEDKDLQLEIDSQNKTFDLATREAEETEENIQDVSVTLIREVEVIEDTVKVESNMTTESDLLQKSPDAHMEMLKVSENSDSDVSIDAIGNSQPEIQPENKIIDLTSEAERTEETICEASVSVREDEFTVDTVILDSNMTTELDLLQSDTLNDANLEALKVCKNTESVSAVTDSVLVQDDVTEGSRLTDTLPEQSHIDIIPEYSHGEEEQAKSSPIVHKRKMGSTRRPLRGNKGQRNEFEHHDENETLDSEGMINAEKQTFSLEDEPSPGKSMLQSTKDVVKEQEMEICEQNNVGPVEGFTESQTLTNINVESQENTGDAERSVAEEDKNLQLEIDSQNKTFDLPTREAEETEENIQDVSVTLIREVEVIEDTDTVESNMTTESEFVETSPDAHMEALKVSKNAEKEVSGETSTIPEQSDISVIPADSHREETHSKSSPVIQKRKMGSTRRPLKGNKGRRNDDDEKEIFNMEDEPSPDESRYTAVSICDISESQNITKIHAESHENIGDVDVGPAEGDTESHSENKVFDSTALEEVEVIGDAVTVGSNMTTESDFQQTCDENIEMLKVSENSDSDVLIDAIRNSQSEVQPENKLTHLTSEAERTEETICEASVSVREDEFTVDTVIAESNMTIESDLLQSDTLNDANLEALKVSKNTESVSAVTDSVLVQDDVTEGSRLTDTLPEQSHIIPEYSHGEEEQAKSSPIVHKRKMGSTRRPLRGNKGQRNEFEHHDKNETLDSEGMINAEKQTFSLEDEPSPGKSMLQSTKDVVKEQGMKICEQNDVGPVEGFTESQTLTNINVKSQENTGDAERSVAEEDKDLQLEIDSQNKTFDLATREAEETEENIQDVSVTLIREVEVIGDTDTVESNMTTESEFLQTSPDAHMEALKVSENAEKEVSGETSTIPEQSDISVIPADSHREETHSKSSPVIQKRKMGSTRKPLKGKKGQRKDIEHHDENETLDSEGMINAEKETVSLKNEPSPDESMLQSTKDVVKEQEMEICQKNDVGPVEEFESALLQSSCTPDLVSEESTAISICHITESQTLTNIHVESQENTGDAERSVAEEDKDLQLEIDSQNKTFDLPTREAEETEENIQDVSVTLIREVEVTGDTDTVESNMTTESEFVETSPDAHMEALKVSKNAEKEVSGETSTVPEQSDISVIPADSHREETHSKSSPVIQKRKMGSTRRPLKGNKGRRNDDDEKEIFNMEDEPSPDESRYTAVSICDISESQNITKIHAESHENIGDVDVGPAEGDTESHSENKVFDSTALEEVEVIGDAVTVGSNMTTESDFQQTCDENIEMLKVSENSDSDVLIDAIRNSQSEVQPENKLTHLTSEAERTEETICEASVSVREDEFTVDTVIAESNMTIESDLLQSDTLNDANLEALKVSKNTESVSAVTDSVLVQDDVTEGSRLTDTLPEQSHIIPEYSHGEEEQAKSSPIVHKRKMGSTRRPLRGNKGQRNEFEHHDKNETLDSEGMINAEKQTFSLEDEPSPGKSMLQSTKDVVKEQGMEICEQNDVGPVEGFTESQTLTNINVESQENTGDAERSVAEEDKDLQLEIDSQNKTFDLATREAEETEENIQDVSVTLIREVEVIGDTDTVESNMTTESEFLQTSPDAHMEALKVSENAEKEVSGETSTIPEQSDISVIPADSHREETHSKSSPVIQKRKMGSTRKPLKGKKGQRKDIEHHDENETLDSEGMINAEKETVSLKNEPSPDESMLQSTKDVVKEQEMEICQKNDVGPVEEFESALLQSSCTPDLVSEESTAISICHITESQTLTNIHVESQENTGDAERSVAEEDKDLQLEIDSQNKTFDLATREAEETEENIQDVSVTLLREVEVTGDTDTMKSNTTTESEFVETSPDAHKEALKVSENVEKDISGETSTIPKQSVISVSPADSPREETHKSSPVIQKRKMGSTRRPLKGNTGRRKGHDEKEIFSLGDEPSPDESRYTAVSICDISESQTITKIHAGSQENIGDVDIAPAEGDTESHSEKVSDSTALEEATYENICKTSALVREDEFIGESIIVDSNVTTESDITQNNTSSEAKLEALKESDNSVHDDQGETDEIPKQRDTTIITEDIQNEEAHSKFTVTHKRKMGSTRRPLRGNKGREIEHQDENETLDSEDTINVEKETFKLESEPSPDESTLQSSNIGPKKQEVEIFEKNDVGPVEEFKSALLQSSCTPDLASEESTPISICLITESQTLTKSNVESQENPGEPERVAVGGDLNLEIKAQNKTFDSTASEAEETEENIQDGSVLVRQPEVIGDTDTLESNMTTESDFLQKSTNAEKEVSGETDTILKQSNVNIIPGNIHVEETHSISSPVIQKRKMGSTRRPLKGNTGRRKGHDEKKIFSLEDDISPGEGDTESHSENKTIYSPAFEGEATEENICTASALDRKVEFIGDAVMVESNMTTESDLIQNDAFTDAKPEALVSEIAENEKVSEEEDTEIQNRDNVVDRNVTQEIINIRNVEIEDRKTTKTVDMSVQELCDDLEQRSDASQTQTGPSQDDTSSHLLKFPERTADFVRDSSSLSDMVLSDALLMGETQIYVSSTDVPPTEVVEMNPVSKKSMQKRKMGSTRKRVKRMVDDEEAEEKEGETENTKIDDETTKSEEKLTLEEAITRSLVHQQLFTSSAEKVGDDIQDIVCKSDVQAEKPEQNDPNSTINPELLIESECSSNVAAEIVSDLPLGDVDTYLDPKQSVISKETHREGQQNFNPVVQKRKMGSTRKTLRGNKGQGKIAEFKKMGGDSKGMTQEQDTEPHLETSARKTQFDEEVEQNFAVEFSNPMASSDMFLEPENRVNEVSQNICDLPVSELNQEKEMDNTGDDSHSLSEAINLNEGTKDNFFLTVSHEDAHQIVSEPEQTENTHKVIPTQELRATQDDVVHENNSQKIPATQEKRRKMGSTRRNPRAMHGKNMADNEDVLGVAEDDLKEALSISQTKEVSSVSTTALESETGATDLKAENDHLHSSIPTVPETPENTLQICDNQLVNADVTKHPQSETVSIEKRRKMGSTRKNLRGGGIRGKRDGYEDTETEDTNPQMSQASEMSLVREDVRKQTTQDYSNQSEDSLLSEIERALNKTSLSSLSCDRELIIKESNSDGSANAPDLNMPENSEIKSLQPMPSAHSEPNSPGGRRRKMGSTRKNPRQQLKAEREDEDKEDGEIDDNSKTNKQEKKDLERVEVSVVHNINENTLNKEYLDVSSAHTSSNQLEESTNPVSQEKTSPSTKRKFGSRRANKGKQGLGRLADSDFGNELEDGDHKPDSSEVKDKLHSDDLAVREPCLTLQPENQPAPDQRKMEEKNEEGAPKGTSASLVSLDHIMKRDSTRAKQTVNLKNRISDTEVVQFNVVMVGNSCVGKTSFIRRFREGQFTEDYRSTIGVDTCVQTVVLPDRTVKLQIWDTAGQERFHSITTQVFHKADGLLLMYEITCSKSFISIRDWISQARERAPDDVIMMLLGNKNDSLKREVQIQEGADLAREYNIHFMECSAATGENVSESMRSLAELLVQRKSQKEKHTTLRREPPQKKSGCC